MMFKMMSKVADIVVDDSNRSALSTRAPVEVVDSVQIW